MTKPITEREVIVKARTCQGRSHQPHADPTSNDARRFSAIGAIQGAAFELVGADTFQTLASRAQYELRHRRGLCTINDQDGRKAELRWFDNWLANHAAD